MTGLRGKSGMEPEKRPFPRPGRNRRQQKPPKAFQDWRSLLWEMEHDPELLLLTHRMEQEYQDRTAGGPRLDPERTLLFHSRHSWVCNFLTAPYFRRAVRRAFQWASERGFTTFLADYGTPFGLLALEELSDLRRSGFILPVCCAERAYDAAEELSPAPGARRGADPAAGAVRSRLHTSFTCPDHLPGLSEAGLLLYGDRRGAGKAQAAGGRGCGSL